MIDISEAVKVGYLHSVVTSNSQNHNISFYEGVMPERAAFLSAMAPLRTEGKLAPKAINDYVTSEVGNELLGHIFTAATVKPKRLSPDRTSYPFSNSQADLTWKKDGTIGFFVLTFGTSVVGTPEVSTARNVLCTVIGTVGDVGSGADIELLGGKVEQGQEYRINDLILQLNT